MSTESDDHTWMYRLADELDALCDQLGVTKISSFVDSTDLELCLREDAAALAEEFELDAEPEPESAVGIDDMAWFDAAAGLTTFQALRASIAANQLPNLDQENHTWLLEELDDCITKLQAVSQPGGMFNLAIIM